MSSVRVNVCACVAWQTRAQKCARCVSAREKAEEKQEERQRREREEQENRRIGGEYLEGQKRSPVGRCVGEAG